MHRVSILPSKLCEILFTFVNFSMILHESRRGCCVRIACTTENIGRLLIAKNIYLTKLILVRLQQQQKQTNNDLVFIITIFNIFITNDSIVLDLSLKIILLD